MTNGAEDGMIQPKGGVDMTCLLYTSCVYSVEHNGRLRKYYRSTGDGRARIRDFLEEWKEVMTVYRFITEEMEAVQDDG